MSVDPKTLAKHFANCITLRVAELPDRTSPEDWPEAMLVTADELHEIIESELIENISKGHNLTDALRRAEEAEAKVQRLKDALFAFYTAATVIGDERPNEETGVAVLAGWPVVLTLGDFRRARKEWED